MKFYGQFDPPVDKFIFERYFPEEGIDGIFVECGAFDGLTECSCKFFEETMGWRGYNLEPVPWIYSKLCENRPDSININAGLSDKSGEAVFKAVLHPALGRDFGNGSLTHADSHLQQLKEIGCGFEDIKVELTTWNDFIEQHEIKFVDIFVLDVEGHELQVIEGMKGAYVLPDIMCVEYGHLGLIRVRAALDELGYVYDITSNGNAYFIKHEKVPLFTARMCSRVQETVPFSEDIGTELQDMTEQVKTLSRENAELKVHLDSLTSLYKDVTESKAWKMIEKIRRLKGRN